MKAKKILIICLAVVIFVLLATIFVCKYYKRGPFAQAAEMLKHDPVVIFNEKFLPYTGKNKGSNISDLVNTIITSNREYSEGKLKYGKFVALKYEGLGGELEDVYITPDSTDLKEEELLKFAELIDKDHYYDVDFKIVEEESDIIINYGEELDRIIGYEIIISYLID